jgi:hypothetical protein
MSRSSRRAGSATRRKWISSLTNPGGAKPPDNGCSGPPGGSGLHLGKVAGQSTYRASNWPVRSNWVPVRNHRPDTRRRTFLVAPSARVSLVVAVSSWSRLRPLPVLAAPDLSAT